LAQAFGLKLLRDASNAAPAATNGAPLPSRRGHRFVWHTAGGRPSAGSGLVRVSSNYKKPRAVWSED